MSSCCSSSSRSIAGHFDPRRAALDLATYRKNGPGRTTRGLVQGIAAADVAPRTVLDIGAGIGTLAFQLLEAGVSRAACVDISPASMDIGRTEAERRGVDDRMSWQVADFAAIASALPPADVVTLDRVVCCYPAFDSLLQHAADHAQVLLAFSYPKDRWYVRLLVAAENLARKVRGNDFRTFVHPVDSMDAVLTRSGLRRVSRTATLTWCMDVYRREAS